MKIPDIAQQPVGEFALGNIRQPDYQALGTAIGEFAAVAGETALEVLYDEETQLSKSTAGAAKDLSELRASLEESNTISTEEIPDGIVAPVSATILDLKGDRVEIGQPRVFTHDVADEWWALKSEEIVRYWADQIKGKDNRAKFLEEVGTRYIAPGTFAIGKSTLIRRRAYGQAIAENTVRDIAAAAGPKNQREEQALGVIDRQAELGADPVWVERQKPALGPLLDQLEIQNQIAGASTVDQIDQIEEDMWLSETRMSPEQIRTMSSQMDIRRREFLAEKLIRQTENTDRAFKEYVVDNTLTAQDVGNMVGDDEITYQAGWTFLNSMNKGDVAKFTNPQVMSQFRGEIVKLKYTGNRSRVSQKADLLELIVARASMGETATGVPTGFPAPITGTDAHKLIKEIRSERDAILESDEYDNALKMVYTWSHVAVDLEGQITTALGGNQHQVDAALSFKEGLDNYMDQFGADAKPVDYFHANRDAFNPNNFADGVNARFFEEVPQVESFMDIDETANTYSFSNVGQDNFILWLDGQGRNLMPDQYDRIKTLFGQFYEGKGLAPENGRLALEPFDPLYHQFEAMLPQAVE